MKKFSLILLFAALTAFGADEKPLSTWALPAVWPRHNQLRQELMSAIRRGDIAQMEATCRAGVALLPGDATWQYNLACALAYREQPEAALAALEQAIENGFRNADAIASDKDFARIKDLPRFAELVEKARALAAEPVAGHPVHAPRYVTTGTPFTLNETNLVFNFDTGLYTALVKFNPPRQPLADLAANFLKSQPANKAAPLVAAWLSEGSAAGNTGDLYLNRDRGHSLISAADFPHLSVVKYAKDAQAANADVDHPNTLFPNPVFGNISRGFTQGPYWRSMARHTFFDTSLLQRMDTLYHNNQFWIIPCVNDVGKPGIGDVFPANAPFQFVTLGASWSDQPFLRAALAASAAFPKTTKEAILRRNLMGPTMQWLLRSTQTDVETEADYLSAKAHPTAFAKERLDVERLVLKAHELKPEQVPPAVSLALINSRLFPIRYPQPGKDYPDIVPELVFSSPSAMAFVLRAPAGTRTFLFRAQPFPEADPTATFTWRVVHGDPKRVKIEAPLGEALNTPEHGFAQITIDRRGLTERLDVACFAKSHGTAFGAPAILSFNPVALETRTYRPDGKLAEIDYTNPDQIYCDPHLALPRAWVDHYSYAPDGTCTGWVRSYKGTPSAAFTAAGERILDRHADGTPSKLQRVRYLPRRTGNEMAPFDLTYMEDGEPYAPPKR